MSGECPMCGTSVSSASTAGARACSACGEDLGVTPLDQRQQRLVNAIRVTAFLFFVPSLWVVIVILCGSVVFGPGTRLRTELGTAGSSVVLTAILLVGLVIALVASEFVTRCVRRAVVRRVCKPSE